MQLCGVALVCVGLTIFKLYGKITQNEGSNVLKDLMNTTERISNSPNKKPQSPAD